MDFGDWPSKRLPAGYQGEVAGQRNRGAKCGGRSGGGGVFGTVRGPADAKSSAVGKYRRSRCDRARRRSVAGAAAVPECAETAEGVGVRQGGGHTGVGRETRGRQWRARGRVVVAVGGTVGSVPAIGNLEIVSSGRTR